MIDWRNLQLGDKLIYYVNEFDSVTPTVLEVEVTEIESDHAIAHGDGMNLWIDDCLADLYYRLGDKIRL